jgi:PAS domain-containing protein
MRPLNKYLLSENTLRSAVKISYKIPENVTKIIPESISGGVFTVDHKLRFMSFNNSAEKITGILRNEIISRHCWEVFRSNICEGGCALKRAMEEEKTFVNTSTYIVNNDICTSLFLHHR